MLKNIKTLYTIIAIAFCAVFLICNIYNQEKVRKEEFYQEKSKFYSGKVKNKFIDRDKHEYETTILTTKYGDSTIIWNQDKSGLFGFIEINDSIVKLPDSYNLNIFRDSVLVKTFVLDWGFEQN